MLIFFYPYFLYHNVELLLVPTVPKSGAIGTTKTHHCKTNIYRYIYRSAQNLKYLPLLIGIEFVRSIFQIGRSHV